MKVYVVTDNEGIIVATYAIEGHARRFCKDNGYSYTEYIDRDSVDYNYNDLLKELELLYIKYNHLLNCIGKANLHIAKSNLQPVTSEEIEANRCRAYKTII